MKRKTKGNLKVKEPEKKRALTIIEYGYGGQVHAMLAVMTLLLLVLGLVMMFSSSSSVSYAAKGDAFAMVKSQLVYTAIGIIVAIAAWFIPPKIYRVPLLSIGLYLMTTLMILAVPLIGTTINGAKRWIPLGPINLQVSEVAKVALVIVLACYYTSLRSRRKRGHYRVAIAKRQKHLDGFLDVSFPVLFSLVWIGPILLQPHVSGAFIMVVITVTMIGMSGLTKTSFRYGAMQIGSVLLGGGLLGALAYALGIGREFLAKLGSNFSHVATRIISFLAEDSMQHEASYQLMQAKIAFGTGGVYGVNLGRSAAKFNYLPEAHNDFIFAVIGEEFGLLGTLFVLLLFVTYALLCFRVVRTAANKTSSHIALGLTVLITLQALLNMGVATGVLPTTGISLPFFSIGGASNIILLLASGIILAIARTAHQEDKMVGSMIAEAKRQRRLEQINQKLPKLVQTRYKKKKLSKKNSHKYRREQHYEQ